jgi:hypothetical protein
LLDADSSAGSPHRLDLINNFSTTLAFDSGDNATAVLTAKPAGPEVLMINRTSAAANATWLMYDGPAVHGPSASAFIDTPHAALFLLSRDSDGSNAGKFADANLGFVFAGHDYSTLEMARLYGLFQNFRKTLGR